MLVAFTAEAVGPGLVAGGGLLGRVLCGASLVGVAGEATVGEDSINRCCRIGHEVFVKHV